MRLVSEESLTVFVVIIIIELARRHSRPPGETMADKIGGKNAVGTTER